MLLFISHASEDQPDFVRPLAEALQDKYEVWYSEYQLVLGDSLLQKIDEGLASCDFGVVILSHAFFNKNWPRAELDALVAREMRSGKIILPVWKDVTVDDVGHYSPILASKLAVSASEGVERVVREIELAVNVSERQRAATSAERTATHVLNFRRTVAEGYRVEQLVRTERGVELVMASLRSLFSAIQNALLAGQDASSPIQFDMRQIDPRALSVSTVRGMGMNLSARQIHTNSVADATLRFLVYQIDWDAPGTPASNRTDFEDEEYKPQFSPDDQVNWARRSTSSGITVENLAEHAVATFLKHVEAQWRRTD
jgi:hypothetical protein